MEIEERKKLFWYAMYAYKREKLAQERLNQKNIENFIPMRYEMKEYHGRKERILTPAISNLIFVHTTKNILTDLKIKLPYLQYITKKIDSRREIIVVPEEQMQRFIKIAERFEEDLLYYKPEEISLEKGSKVRVHGGVFDGVEGVLLKIKGKRSKRIVVSIPGIVAIAAAHIEPEFIEIIS